MVFGFLKKKKTETAPEKGADKGDKAEVVEKKLDSDQQDDSEIAVVETDITETEIEKTVEPEPATPETAPEVETTEVPTSETAPAPVDEPPKKRGYFARLKAGLAKTGAGIGNIFLGKKAIDDELLEDLETALLMADVGIEATQEIIDDLTDSMRRNELGDQQAVVTKLKASMTRILAVSEAPLEFKKPAGKPFVLLMVGIWGERADVPVIAQGTGADSASVIYDAYESAKAKGIDVLIADTAGRLHTQ